VETPSIDPVEKALENRSVVMTRRSEKKKKKIAISGGVVERWLTGWRIGDAVGVMYTVDGQKL